MSRHSKHSKPIGKRVGKHGEKAADLLLTALGWYIADRQIDGLAGDDIFARDPDGTWWSIEVKNAQKFDIAWVYQAKQQATERRQSLVKHAGKSKLNEEVMEFLGMTEFDRRNWLLLWHPRRIRTRNRMWIAATQDDAGYTHFIAPFLGEVDTSWKKMDELAEAVYEQEEEENEQDS